MLEGRANAFTVDIEAKMALKLSQMRGSLMEKEEMRETDFKDKMAMVESAIESFSERFE